MKHEHDGDKLWMVLAIIQPFKLDAVTLGLEALPHFGGMTVSECRGFGHGKVAGEPGAIPHDQRSDAVDFTPKIRLEVAVNGQAQTDTVIDTIARIAHTGNPGDGKIFSWPLERAVRVRTLDEGALAL